MCPGLLRFTFIQRSLVTHDSCSQTLSGYTKVKAGPSSSNSPLLSTVYFSICQCEINYATFFFSFASLFDLWVHFVVCCSFCAVTYQKKERFFFLCKGTKSFSMCKTKGRMLKYKTSRKICYISSLAKVICKISFIFKDFLSACVTARLSMFLCFLQQNL